MLTAYVHPRLGLPNFFKFEPYFKSALEAFDRGEETVFTIAGGLSPTTIAARMRDSLAGYRINKAAWRASVDATFADLFDKHDGKFVISGPDPQGRVMLRARRPAGYLKPGQLQFHEASGDLGKFIKARTQISPTIPSSEPAVRLKTCDEATVRTMVGLRVAGTMTVPVIFEGQVSTLLITELTSLHDIALQHDPIRNETILI